ncbi:MAG: ParB/RepB/Spo0J family partition protein [Eubacteriaceae bacterium]|nr:ParB/RepB/Spo0J family partition protein [Eubacteriaceae bacterium]
MKPNSVLGKGLDALIPYYAHETEMDEVSAVQELPIEKIKPNPNQPRKIFTEDTLAELSQSIQAHGILQPLIVVDRDDGTYMIVAGERRWRAASMTNLKTVPAIVRSYSDEEVLAISLVENLQRENLHDLEKASTYQMLIDQFQLTHESLAATLGISRAAVTNTLRLLSLSQEEQDALLKEQITAGHARALLSLPLGPLRTKALNTMMKKRLSVRDAETLVRNLSKPAAVAPLTKESNHAALETELSALLGRKVLIHPRGKRGNILLEYYDANDREHLIDALKKLAES